MISIRNLTVKFSDNIVLNGISTNFLQHQIYGIVGLNGAGKTTFFNTLSGNIKPDNGMIDYMGKTITKKDIGYLETVNYFYSKITGHEYLKIFKQTNSNFDLTSLQIFLKLPLDDLIETYSTGMKKKLALLGFLKKDKPFYLLDEPFNGLDLETNKILELIITALKEKHKTVFVSSHIIEPLLTICDEIRILENGQFSKTFRRDEFYKIEQELFGKLKEQAKNVIIKSI